MLSKRHRLKSRREFHAVYSRGRKYVGGTIVMRAIPTVERPSRFGFSVSEKVGCAVVRNKVKRRLREAVRKALTCTRFQGDAVIVARETAASADFGQLCREVGQAVSYMCRNQGQGGRRV